MSPTENDLRDLLLCEAADIGEMPPLPLPSTSRRPYLPVAAGVVMVLAIVGVGTMLAGHGSGEHRLGPGGSPSSQLGGDPAAGIGPAGTACIRSAGSVPPLDPANLAPGVATYHAAVGKPVTIAATAPVPLDKTVTDIRIGATGPGTPAGDCALATTARIVASGRLQAGMALSYTFTPWEPGNYAIGLQAEPEIANAETSPNTPVARASDGEVTGTLIAIVEAN